LNKIVKIFAMLAVLILLTITASSMKTPTYVVKNVGTNHIRLEYNFSEAKDLSTKEVATDAAQEIVDLATLWNMNRTRSLESIRNEIQYKADQSDMASQYPLYMRGQTSMEIHVNETEWGWLAMVDSGNTM
jgi:hypothetical protein